MRNINIKVKTMMARRISFRPLKDSGKAGVRSRRLLPHFNQPLTPSLKVKPSIPGVARPFFVLNHSCLIGNTGGSLVTNVPWFVIGCAIIILESLPDVRPNPSCTYPFSSFNTYEHAETCSRWTEAFVYEYVTV